VADHLLLRHHTVVELVDRATRADLVERVSDEADQRVVRVRLTPEGERRLHELSAGHLEELGRMGGAFAALWNQLPSRSGEAGQEDEEGQEGDPLP
jgi:DNA-binding MarR family transcriptional regulator